MAITVVFDRARKLRFTLGEIKSLEGRLGKPAGDVFADLGKLSVTALQHVLWAGLRHDDKGLRLDTVETLMQSYLDDGHDLGDLLQVVNEAILDSGLFGRGAGRPEASHDSTSAS